jgi:hypothetical protein
MTSPQLLLVPRRITIRLWPRCCFGKDALWYFPFGPAQWQQDAPDDHGVPRYSAYGHLIIEALPNDPSAAHLSRPCLSLLSGGLPRPVQTWAPAHRPDHVRGARRENHRGPATSVSSPRRGPYSLGKRRGHSSESYRRRAPESRGGESRSVSCLSRPLTSLPVGPTGHQPGAAPLSSLSYSSDY